MCKTNELSQDLHNLIVAKTLLPFFVIASFPLASLTAADATGLWRGFAAVAATRNQGIWRSEV